MGHYNPDQYSEQSEGLPTQRELDEQKFTAWIKPDILAEIIFEELDSAGIPPTISHAEFVWLDMLEHELYLAVKSSIKNTPAFAEYFPGNLPIKNL